MRVATTYNGPPCASPASGPRPASRDSPSSARSAAPTTPVTIAPASPYPGFIDTCPCLLDAPAFANESMAYGGRIVDIRGNSTVKKQP